jgi:acetyl coenzyme A synthetase (ADP forming)-like protein
MSTAPANKVPGSGDTLPTRQKGLDYFFSPSGVAIIGASRDQHKLGFGVVRNLRDCGYQGGIYPVNPRGGEILGYTCYPSILDVPDPVELAVLIVPVAATPGVMAACGERGIRAAIVVSGGFRESGPEGAQIEAEVASVAHRYGMRLMGPNCIGVIDTTTPLDTSFVAMPQPGNIGFFSQSGAICGGLINWTRGRRIGFSRFVSLGNQADVNETDILEFLAADDHTKVIAAYLEGVSDGARFSNVARRVSASKPIVVLKVGGTEDGTRAVSSHTGALAGSEKAYQAAFTQAGIIRAGAVEELLDWCYALSSQPLPAGDGMAVLTNAGGPGVLAVDALQRAGLHLASLEVSTLAALRTRFPPECALHNPVDLLAAADAGGYADALALLLADRNVSGVVVLHVPHVLVDAPRVLEAIGRTAQAQHKPVVASLFGDYAGTPELDVLHRFGVPHFPSPERASGALGALRRYGRWRQKPAAAAEDLQTVDRDSAAAIIREVRLSGRLKLMEAEARSLLAAYGVPVLAGEMAGTAEEAVAAAERMGFPVVLKIASPDILHKTDAGGVALNLRDARAVKRAFREVTSRSLGTFPEAVICGVQVQAMLSGGQETIIGATRDAQFGHLLMFGLGGIFVEVLGDVSFRVAPVSRPEVMEMMRETRAFRLLQGFRGQPAADLDAIADCLLRVSRLVTDFPEIEEMDINPLAVRGAGEGAIALDARVILRSSEAALR